MDKTFRKILIIKPSALGDIVLALPALSALRKSFPDAKISWLVRPEYAPLIENHKYLDEVIIFDRKRLGKWWYQRESFKLLCELVAKIRSEKFDVVFDFQGLLRSALFGWLGRCRRRVGMKNARELARLFYTEKIAPDKDKLHLVDYYIKLARTVGAAGSEVDFALEPTNEAIVKAGNLLAASGVDTANYAVIAAGSAQRSKCWPVEKFARLAEKINADYGCDIVAGGSGSEKDIIEQLKAAADCKIADLAGRTGIAELVALLAGAKIVVSNDSGPGHIAAGLGSAVVIVFAWSNPKRIMPYNRPECMVAKGLEQRGDKLKNFAPQFDVRKITVDEVFEKVKMQMKKSSESSGD